PENSHVIPALIRKFHEGKINQSSTVTVWGSGKPQREFLYSEDMAEACVYLMELENSKLNSVFNHSKAPLINVGFGEDLTIHELATLVADVVGFQGNIQFDTTKPDGTFKKLTDINLIKSLGWYPKTKLKNGLSMAYEDFLRTGISK
ncbi:MAG: NAD-dependent epimerase/dehydratase family protein, partial [Nitrosomonadales bacterium]|nr:NAD-dependent epimerase/dehydratase family protein [Nitrosomonadales bacterium]